MTDIRVVDVLPIKILLHSRIQCGGLAATALLRDALLFSVAAFLHGLERNAYHSM